MKKVGIGIDYSNICKDYNTVYLDRDNTDPATSKCMKQVLTWSASFLTELLEKLDYNIYNLSSSSSVNIDDISSKRFLFYSLEKEITLQSYVLYNEYIEYESLAAWELADNESILVKNDEDGGAIYLYFKADSLAYEWVKDKLQGFSIDEKLPFEAK